MAWIGIADRNGAILAPEGIDVFRELGGEPRIASGALLTVGTLLVEVTHEGGTSTQSILDYQHMSEWQRAICLTLCADGIAEATIQQGLEVRQVKLRLGNLMPGARLRISLSWNAPKRDGLFTIEDLDQSIVYQTEFRDPVAIPMDDIERLMRQSALPSQGLPNATSYVAVSDAVERVGLTLGIAAGTMVATDMGEVPIQTLMPGDKVLTATGELGSVRCVLQHRVPARGAYSPLRLRAPFFGLSQDLTVARDQRMMVRGDEAEYLFGKEEVLVSARHMRRGHGFVPVREPQLITYCQVLLDAHACICMNGGWGESLYLGDLARQPEILNTTLLSGFPVELLPDRDRCSYQMLDAFEAATLLTARVA